MQKARDFCPKINSIGVQWPSWSLNTSRVLVMKKIKRIWKVFWLRNILIYISVWSGGISKYKMRKIEIFSKHIRTLKGSLLYPRDKNVKYGYFQFQNCSSLWSRIIFVHILYLSEIEISFKNWLNALLSLSDKYSNTFVPTNASCLCSLNRQFEYV